MGENNHDPSMKLELAARVFGAGETLEDVAESNGVGREQIDEWRRRLEEKGTSLFDDSATGVGEADDKSVRANMKQLVREFDMLESIVLEDLDAQTRTRATNLMQRLRQTIGELEEELVEK